MTEPADILRIMIPCDFSQACRQALEACVKFNWGKPAELFALIVQEPAPAGNPLRSTDAQSAQWLKAFSPAVQIRVLTVKGRFVTAVLEAVAMHQIELIVVGTRGARGWDGVFVGSHAEKIVRLSPVPVLALPQQSHLAGLPDLVLPIDIDKNPSVLAACLAKVPGLFTGRVHLLHVQTGRANSRQAATKAFSEYSHKLGLAQYVSTVIYAEEICEGILRYTRQVGADLIAMQTSGDADLGHMFRPSIAADVVNHAKIPVYTCQLGQKQPLASL